MSDVREPLVIRRSGTVNRALEDKTRVYAASSLHRTISRTAYRHRVPDGRVGTCRSETEQHLIIPILLRRASEIAGIA